MTAVTAAWAAVMPVKYEHNSKELTDIFPKSKLPWKEINKHGFSKPDPTQDMNMHDVDEAHPEYYHIDYTHQDKGKVMWWLIRSHVPNIHAKDCLIKVV